MKVKSRVRIRLFDFCWRACIAIQSGANIAIIVIHGCCPTACISAGCVSPNAEPMAVTMMLTKTRPYVRRTSVARSSPDRTRVPGNETPMLGKAPLKVLEIYPVDDIWCGVAGRGAARQRIRHGLGTHVASRGRALLLGPSA